MATSIVQIHDFIRFIERKERGVFHTIEEVDLFLDRCQMEVYEELISIYAQTQKIHDALSVFKSSFNFTSSSTGLINLPSDYLHLRSAYTVIASTMYPIRFPEDDEYVEAVKSQLRPVSTTRPLGVHEENTIQLNPATLQYGVINYFRRPDAPVYAYTLNGREIVYDSGNSVQLEWNDTTYLNKIMLRVLAYFGINLSEPDITAFGVQYNQNVS